MRIARIPRGSSNPNESSNDDSLPAAQTHVQAEAQVDEPDCVVPVAAVADHHTTHACRVPPATCHSQTMGRREKRRFFRRARVDERVCINSNSSDNNNNHVLPAATATATTNDSSDGDDQSDDTIGSLPHSHSQQSEPAQESFSPQRYSSTTIAPRGDYVPTPVLPGAVYTRGRAFGALPEWAQQRQAMSENIVSSSQGDLMSNGGDDTVHVNADDHPQYPPSSPIFPPPLRPLERLRGSSLGSSIPNCHHPTTIHGTPRGSRLLGSVRTLFTSFRSSSQLLEAEILDSEKVVYAEIVPFREGLVASWELLGYSIVVLMIGIVIGRLTVHFPITSHTEL